MEETEITCPFCFEQIPLLVDTSVENQDTIEDCSVCCRPIRLLIRCSPEGEFLGVEPGRS
jgi:hypothetical protein